MTGGFFLCFIIDASKYFHVNYESGEDQSQKLELQLLLRIPYMKFTFLCIKHTGFFFFTFTIFPSSTKIFSLLNLGYVLKHMAETWKI